MAEIVLEDDGYLAARAPQKTLEIPDDKKQANFELGVSMVLYKWEDLTTAVDNNWGGPDSAGKRDWMTGLVIDAFKENAEIDIIYIHELLFNAMQDEFDAVIEDESTVVAAQRIVQIYKDCLGGDFENVQKMYQKWLNSNHTKNIVTVQDNDDDDDDDDDDDEDIPELTEGDDMDVDMDAAPEHTHNHSHQEPEVDDDGFTVVRRGRH